MQGGEKKKMKKNMVIAGFLALSIAMVMFGTVAAAPTISTIVISGPGVVWQFTPAEGEVTNVQAYYYSINDKETEVPMPTPLQTNIRDGFVTLIFSISDTKDLAGTVYQTGVHFLLDGVPTTISQGPGFAWGRTR